MADDPAPAVSPAPMTPEEQVALGAPLLPGSRTEIGYLALEALKLPATALRMLLGSPSRATDPVH